MYLFYLCLIFTVLAIVIGDTVFYYSNAVVKLYSN